MSTVYVSPASRRSFSYACTAILLPTIGRSCSLPMNLTYRPFPVCSSGMLLVRGGRSAGMSPAHWMMSSALSVNPSSSMTGHLRMTRGPFTWKPMTLDAISRSFVSSCMSEHPKGMSLTIAFFSLIPSEMTTSIFLFMRPSIAILPSTLGFYYLKIYIYIY